MNDSPLLAGEGQGVRAKQTFPPPNITRENENGSGLEAKLHCKSHRHQTLWLSSLGLLPTPSPRG